MVLQLSGLDHMRNLIRTFVASGPSHIPSFTCVMLLRVLRLPDLLLIPLLHQLGCLSVLTAKVLNPLHHAYNSFAANESYAQTILPIRRISSEDTDTQMEFKPCNP